MPNCHTAILKWEFGIGPRDKQKLNLEWKTKRYVGTRGTTYDQWLDKHQSWSWLGQGKEGKAAMGGYTEPWYENPILNATCFSYGKMKDEMMVLCQCWTCAHDTDEMVNQGWQIWWMDLMKWGCDPYCWSGFFLEPLVYWHPFMQWWRAVSLTWKVFAVSFMLLDLRSDFFRM